MLHVRDAAVNDEAAAATRQLPGCLAAEGPHEALQPDVTRSELLHAAPGSVQDARLHAMAGCNLDFKFVWPDFAEAPLSRVFTEGPHVSISFCNGEMSRWVDSAVALCLLAEVADGQGASCITELLPVAARCCCCDWPYDTEVAI